MRPLVAGDQARVGDLRIHRAHTAYKSGGRSTGLDRRLRRRRRLPTQRVVGFIRVRSSQIKHDTDDHDDQNNDGHDPLTIHGIYPQKEMTRHSTPRTRPVLPGGFSVIPTAFASKLLLRGPVGPSEACREGDISLRPLASQGHPSHILLWRSGIRSTASSYLHASARRCRLGSLYRRAFS